MIFITQLIYIKDGQQAIFNEFESVAIPIIANYNGQLLLRIRPTESEIIACNMDVPYEIHLVKFASESDFADFMNDETRKQFLHLKEQSIRTSILIKGIKI